MLLPQAATDTSLLVTHNKKAADKERALRSFAPMGQGTACPNSLPQAATDTSLLVTHNKKAAGKGRALRSFAPMGARYCVPE